MIRLYAEQLGAQLKKSLHPCYLLFGNDALLLNESQEHIRKQAHASHFDEHFSVMLDASTDWEALFNLCQARSLFACHQTLLLILPDGDAQAALSKKLLQLASLLHDDLLVILRGSKLTSTLKNSTWFKIFSQKAVLVNCDTPEQAQLPRWVATRAKKMKLILNADVCQLLCYCYEGNLLALVQALTRLALIYPDGNLTLSRVKAAVSDAAHFTPFHWIETVLTGKSKRAVHILRQLRMEGVEPVILLRYVQREVLLLLTLKRKMIDTQPHALFDDQHTVIVWKKHRTLLTKALKRLTLVQLNATVTLMKKIELTLKQNYNYPVWSDFNALTLLLCGKTLPVAMIDG